jgi:hypothetical protein
VSQHLTDDVLLDVLEGAADEEARTHYAECTACARRVDEARDGLALLGEAEVPEPSPLYWASFRRQVGHRLSSPAFRLARPALLAPLLAAAAAVAVALWGSFSVHAPSGAGPGVASVLPAWSALPPLDEGEGEDEALAVLRAVAPSAEEMAVGASCQGAAACLVAELSDEESAALVDALRQELPAARGL